jgi:hypothetical protein
MEGSALNWNKENNSIYNNMLMRKNHLKTLNRPATPL